MTINVRGTKFITLRNILQKYNNSYFTSKEFISQIDEEGHYFIDRDPEIFEIVLNNLRDGSFVLKNEYFYNLPIARENYLWLIIYNEFSFYKIPLEKDSTAVTQQSVSYFLFKQYYENMLTKYLPKKHMIEKIKTHIIQIIYTKHLHNYPCTALFTSPYVNSNDAKVFSVKGTYSKEDWIKAGVEFLNQEDFDMIDANTDWILWSFEYFNSIYCLIRRGYVGLFRDKEKNEKYLGPSDQQGLTNGDSYNQLCFTCTNYRYANLIKNTELA